ncbi:MAG: OmpA family protein, partial [Rhodobacteraceae bacterium]|nr:OmpA family protein [Paracoccaceae bacterium]
MAVLVSAMIGGLLVGDAAAQTRTVVGERFVPAIWVDPDGCQHWVMDDGWEGYMTPNRRPDGTPVCNRPNACLVENSDQLFATGSHQIAAAHRQRLHNFFATLNVTSIVVDGHTDPRGGYEYNMRLSERRAMAVAQIAQ